MSKQLILIRHSYAENGSFNTNDFDRKLTKKGIDYALIQGNKLVKYISYKTLFISSDAIRAQQTSTIISKALNYSKTIMYEHFLYEDYSTQDFINFVSKQNNTYDKLIILGHNPTLANIAYRLCPEFNHSVPPGTIIILDFDIKNWNEIEVNGAKLIDVKN